MSINNNRKVPQNIEAEEALLGAVLFDPDSFKEIESKIKAKMFSIRKHQLIYVAISNLSKEKVKPNLDDVKLVIFDMDDTLYPEREFVIKGYQEVSKYVMNTYGIFIEDELRRRFDEGQRGDLFSLVLLTLSKTNRCSGLVIYPSTRGK